MLDHFVYDVLGHYLRIPEGEAVIKRMISPS
jgi:hypothetical protein